MPTLQELEAVEARLEALLARYTPPLVTGTIYGMPSLVWPGSGGHDYFASLKRGAKYVSLYLIIADRHPDELAACSPELLGRRTGRATWTFTKLDDDLAADLTALLDQLFARYRIEHGD